MSMERVITIYQKNIQLIATLHYPDIFNDSDHTNRIPVIVICHGFVGNRIGESRLFVKSARFLADSGYMVLRFDYAGCGESTGEYGEGGMGSMIEQTRLALDYVLDIDLVDASRVTLIGHSLGGAVALCTAAQDRRVASLALWSAVAYPFTDIVKIVGKKLYNQCLESGQADYLGFKLKPFFFESLAEHQPFDECKNFYGDVFFAHGTNDQVVPVDYCFLYEKMFWAHSGGCSTSKEVILQADHAYSDTNHFQQLITKTRDWLESTEKKKTEWANWMI